MHRIPAILSIVLLVGVTPGLATTASADGPVMPGPFAGVVQDGQTNEHHFNNNVPLVCSHVITKYVVVVEYAPTHDRLSVTVGDETAMGQGGVAVLETRLPVCTSVHIKVTGEDVEETAAYTVEVAWLPN